MDINALSAQKTYGKTLPRHKISLILYADYPIKCN